MAWRISHSGKVTQDVKKVCAQAGLEGRLDEVLELLARMDSELAESPLEFGEAYADLKHFKLTLCVAVRNPLVIDYAVDKERQIVYLRSVTLRA